MNNYLTFIGHSTLLINLNGFNILTDPVFSKWVHGVPRFKKARINVEDIKDNTDLILISHAHKDHLNRKTLKKFSKEIPIASHRNNLKYLKKCNFDNMIGFAHWETRDFHDDSIKITSVPAYHRKTLPWGPIGTSGGFVIESPKQNIYFAGDTAFEEQLFRDIANKFQIDILLMPVGAYSPRWMLKYEHTNPEEALEAMRIIGAGKMIPIHWGSFMFALDTPKRPINVLKKLIIGTDLESKVQILKNGQTIYF
ncbi:MAG: MBL fold metallo-hydrolase [Minisyncoccia bacterium]